MVFFRFRLEQDPSAVSYTYLADLVEPGIRMLLLGSLFGLSYGCSMLDSLVCVLSYFKMS